LSQDKAKKGDVTQIQAAFRRKQPFRHEKMLSAQVQRPFFMADGIICLVGRQIENRPASRLSGDESRKSEGRLAAFPNMFYIKNSGTL
jgi:hypothetical protein